MGNTSGELFVKGVMCFVEALGFGSHGIDNKVIQNPSQNGPILILSAGQVCFTSRAESSCSFRFFPGEVSEIALPPHDLGPCGLVC